MKAILISLIILLFVQSVNSQKLFIYGERGEKIYLQETDSLIQIKFRKDVSFNEQLKVVSSIDPGTKFSYSKSTHLIIPLKKDGLPDFANLSNESSVTYANKSLISADGILQFPTEKVLVKAKDSIQIEEVLHFLNIDYESISRLGSDKNSYLIKLKNGESIHVANLLYESGYFEYAQPSFTRLIKMTNEFYPNQWGLNNTGQNGGTVGIDINAPEAWTMTRGCNNIRVAVIDQGIDLDHPDLAANLLPGFDATDGGDGGTNGDCWGNDAHGTCCAGIIGAINNTIGTIGVAHDCRIIPIRVSYTQNNNEIWDDDWVVNAINHAWEDDGADVLSCSWRYQNVVAVNNEINNALTLGRNSLGCVIVFAAGNFNNSVSYPANSNPDIIAVGAMSPCGQRKRSSSNIRDVNPGVSTDPQGVSCDNEKWWGSNYGNQLDLVAPGVFVPTTDIQGNAGYNTSTGIAGNYYQTFNGTSSATPHVAGVAALILSINSTLTQDQVRDIIESTCTKVVAYTYSTATGRANGKWNNEVGYGCVNAFAALQAVFPVISGPSTVCSTGATFTVSNVPEGCNVTWAKSANITFDNLPGNPKTFYANGTGSGWVQATVNSTTCGQVTLPARTVWIGPPAAPNNLFSTESPVCRNAEVLSVCSQSGIQYYWNWGGAGLTYLSGQSSPRLFLETTSSFNHGIVRLMVKNGCGWSPYSDIKHIYLNPNCDSPYTVFPNPGTNIITIESANNTTLKPGPATNAEIQQVELIDKMGKTVYENHLGKSVKVTTIQVSNLLNDFYTLRIFDGKQWYTQKVIVQH